MAKVSLGSDLEAFVEAQVRSGRFHDASDVVRAGLRLLAQQERERAEHAMLLADAINASFDEPGEDRSIEEVFERLESRCRQDMNARPRGA
jgi:antitoxin ParD1/3/4